MKKRRIPVILVNARLSKRSFAGYYRLRPFIKKVLANFAAICVQTTDDAKHFRLLGVPTDKIIITGNFKFDQPFEVTDSANIEELRGKLNLSQNDKIFIAGSTHKGEETQLADVFSTMKKASDHYRFIVAPRNPERADSIRRIFEATGFSVILMQELLQITDGSRFDVVVVDVIGMLRDLYALADCAFIGGSLVARGGHNPLEPAVFSKPIIFGPDMSNFAEISTLLLASKAAVQVKDSKDLLNAATMIINDEKRGHALGQNAYRVFVANQGAVKSTLHIVKALLADEFGKVPKSTERQSSPWSQPR